MRRPHGPGASPDFSQAAVDAELLAVAIVERLGVADQHQVDRGEETCRARRSVRRRGSYVQPTTRAVVVFLACSAATSSADNARGLCCPRRREAQKARERLSSHHLRVDQFGCILRLTPAYQWSWGYTTTIGPWPHWLKQPALLIRTWPLNPAEFTACFKRLTMPFGVAIAANTRGR